MRTDTLQKTFGAVLRNARLSLGLSQEALALNAGVDRSFVSQIERVVRQPALKTIWRLAAAVRKHPSELLAKVEDELN